jgi:hypothetical protein
VTVNGLIGDHFLALDAVFCPGHRSQTLRCNRLLAGKADSELAKL